MVKSNFGKLQEPFPVMKYIQIYLFTTIALYFFGPIDWATKLPLLTFAIVALYQFALWTGYNCGSRKNTICRPAGHFTFDWFVKRFWIIASVVLLIASLRIVRMTYLYGFSGVKALLETAFFSASDIYMGDKTATEGSHMFGGTLLSLAIGFAGPFAIMFVPMTIITFRKISFGKKVLGIFTIVVFALSKMVAGTNEGFFEPALYMVVGFLLKGRADNQAKKNRNGIWLVLGVIAVIFIFNLIMTDRNGVYYEFSQLGENRINLEKGLYKYVPDGMKILFIWLTFYIAQGYYGLSLALIGDWTPMFGAGFSSYLRGNLQPFFSHDLAQDTLMATTNQYGWLYGVNWHSVYPWFASDIWWIGVVLVMFGMGFLMGQSFKEAYYTKNPISVGLFALLLMFCVFIPANNKVFANSDTFFAFFTYLFIWLHNHSNHR